MDVLRTIMDEIECVVSKVEKEEIDRVVNLIRKDRRIFVAGEGRRQDALSSKHSTFYIREPLPADVYAWVLCKDSPCHPPYINRLR